jgi:N-acetylglucosaminyldiphosphoundecaprenol N-acetyl-beta-D-mannosaminyltransferase
MYIQNGELPWDDSNDSSTTTVSDRTPFNRISSPRLISRDGRHERLPAVTVHGVTLHAVTEAGAIRYILDELAAHRGGTVVTPNLDHLRRCEKDMSFRALVAEADVVVADGMPLIWASKVQGTPLPERVAGSDLISSLSAAAANAGRSIFLLGGDPGTADAAAKVLLQRHPLLKIVGTLCPPYGFDKNDAQIHAIESALSAARPDIVFVALGSPKQEMLVERIRRVLPHAWWLGVGNSFSFLSGQVRRAPLWMQRHGVEWIHRLTQEPKRLFKRYIVNGVPFAARMFARSALIGLPKKINSSKSLPSFEESPTKRETSTLNSPASAPSISPIFITANPDPSDTTPLHKLRAVVLLAGAVRPMPIAAATGRSILDLPLDSSKTILQQWIDQTQSLAQFAGLPQLPIRAMVNGHSPDPLGAATVSHLVRVERDFGEYRGTGGLLRDLARDYDDDDLILVANAFQLLIDPLADIARAMARLGGQVGLVSHHDGTPSGLMLVTCKALRLISEAGYVDMKEQALPQIASRYDVSVLHRRRPTGLPIRSLSDYIFALRTHHRRSAGRPAITSDPLAEDWRPTFSIVEDGAIVDPAASIHDSVILRGARVEPGAVAVRSVVCPRGIVRRDVPAVDQFVTASPDPKSRKVPQS